MPPPRVITYVPEPVWNRVKQLLNGKFLQIVCLFFAVESIFKVILIPKLLNNEQTILFYVVKVLSTLLSSDG